ncbi:MAG: hypothetical protein K2P76_01590 [Lachnospiraceae bacterium]|nr:hypothetical protein [Lachnospiraceae bacterium]
MKNFKFLAGTADKSSSPPCHFCVILFAVFVDSRVKCVEVFGIQALLDEAQGFTETGGLK